MVKHPIRDENRDRITHALETLKDLRSSKSFDQSLVTLHTASVGRDLNKIAIYIQDLEDTLDFLTRAQIQGVQPWKSFEYVQRTNKRNADARAASVSEALNIE